MTTPVIDAGYLAPVVARLDTLETSLRLLAEVVDRQREDVVNLEQCAELMQHQLKELRDAVEGGS